MYQSIFFVQNSRICSIFISQARARTHIHIGFNFSFKILIIFKEKEIPSRYHFLLRVVDVSTNTMSHKIALIFCKKEKKYLVIKKILIYIENTLSLHVSLCAGRAFFFFIEINSIVSKVSILTTIIFILFPQQTDEIRWT